MLGLGLIASCLAGGAAAMPVEANEAEGAWSELVQQVLLQIQGWVELQARGTAADARLAKAGVDAAFRLLAALERCLEPATYLGCLHAVVAGSSVDKVQRRALELLAAAVNGVTDEVRAAMTEVALGACDIALELVRSTWQQEGSSSSMPTMQAAIGTLSALATAYGNKHPQRFVAALGQLLEVLRHDDAAVRGSACTAVATMARAVGTHLVPVLPAVLPAILGIAKAAIAAAAAGDKGLDESTALQLSAALAAVAELVDTLGAFLAPHVPALLPILVHPAVLDVSVLPGHTPAAACLVFCGIPSMPCVLMAICPSCCAQTSSGLCAESAAHIRQQLSQTMPPRLLLPSLLAHLDAAVAVSSMPLCNFVSWS